MPLGEAGGRTRALLLAALSALAIALLALPSFANAAQFEVDSAADEVDLPTAGCLTASGKCTLRAAIEAANASANTGAEPDRILFAAAFDGGATSTIEVGISLPPVTDPVRIDGGECLHGVGEVPGPCVGVDGPSSPTPGLTVEGADTTEIAGLAITNSATGIVVRDSAAVSIEGSWLGLGLDGGAGANAVGILVEQKSNAARIGGVAPGAGNVFANNSKDGLRIFGADEAVVSGNYFGVMPDGITAAGNGENIEVSSDPTGGFVAERNLIGVQPPFTGPATPECDIGCNVIAAATNNGSGVDLDGDSFEAGTGAVETHIAGNYIGLAINGLAVVANDYAGVLVGDAASTLIGGADPSEANRIHGGLFGIFSGGSGYPAKGLVVQGNLIGRNLANTTSKAPPSISILLESAGIADPDDSAQVRENTISSGLLGIEQSGAGAVIADNAFLGGRVGLRLYGFNGGIGNTATGNTIKNTLESAIVIESNSNLVAGNEIRGALAAGVLIRPSPIFPLAPTGNLVGGDSEAEENLISGSKEAAVKVVDELTAGEESENEIARNHGDDNGSENEDPFIDLVGAEANGGIVPPAIAVAKVTEASGVEAESGALVRVFRKEDPAPGELASFLGETVADDDGSWQLTYPGAIPGGTIVAATQTTAAGGTSELATATTEGAPDPEPETEPEAGGGGKGGGGQGGGGAGAGGSGGAPGGAAGAGGSGGKAADTTPPQTKILAGPPKRSAKTSVRFRFAADERGASFRCKLDRGPYRVCGSPKRYKRLQPGRHVFKVRAVDKLGNIDPTAARLKFTVVG